MISSIQQDKAKGLSLRAKQRLRPLQSLYAKLRCGSDLSKLADYYHTDKNNGHFYTQHYEKHFRPIRNRPLSILEIGIGGNESPTHGGGSLRMWRGYFPKARIAGIDLYDKSLHDEKRIRTYRGNQVDTTFLESVLESEPPPDIIIDDGSHRCEHVIATFQILFPKLKNGGLYVVEDLQTSYWEEYGGSHADPDHPRTSMGYFKGLVHGLNHAEFRSHYEPTVLDLSIHGMHFYHNLLFIDKGENNEPSYSC